MGEVNSGEYFVETLLKHEFFVKMSDITLTVDQSGHMTFKTDARHASQY